MRNKLSNFLFIGDVGQITTNPSPCDYNPVDFKSKHSPAWNYKPANVEKRKGISREALPGPGSYHGNIEATRKHKPQFSFANSTSQRREGNKSSVLPGPGQYDGVQKYSSAAFTMGARTGSQKTIETSANIGTDQYIKKNIGCKFPKAKRDYTQLGHSDSPGPGAYTHNNASKNKTTSKNGFGLGERITGLSQNKSKNAPGPGTYSISEAIWKSSNGFSIKSKYDDHDKMRKLLLPGPGTYNTSSEKSLHRKSPT